MKKNSSQYAILVIACISTLVIFCPAPVFAVGEYNGVWVGVDTISIPDHGSFDETTGTVIYQKDENELFIYDPLLPSLRLIRSGSQWILPSPMWVDFSGDQVYLASVAITFQGESHLTGSITLQMEGVSATATLNHSKYSCQILNNGATLSGLSGDEDSIRCYEINLPTDATDLNLRTWGGAGDCDLYLIYHRPDFDEYLSENISNNEEITLAAPHPGRWYAILYGFESYSGLNLSASYVDPASRPRPTTMPWIPLLLFEE